MWMPYVSQDTPQSGDDFGHYITNAKVPEEVWMKAEPRPRGGGYTPTIVYLGADTSKHRGYNGVKSWWQIHEDWPASSFCHLPNTEQDSVVAVLRGLCKNSMIDKYYQVRNDERGYVTFFGFASTIIYYEVEEDRWALTLSNNPLVKHL